MGTPDFQFTHIYTSKTCTPERGYNLAILMAHIYDPHGSVPHMRQLVRPPTTKAQMYPNVKNRKFKSPKIPDLCDVRPQGYRTHMLHLREVNPMTCPALFFWLRSRTCSGFYFTLVGSLTPGLHLQVGQISPTISPSYSSANPIKSQFKSY